jgi:hypothetical protein
MKANDLGAQSELGQSSCMTKLTWKTRAEAVAARAYAAWQYGEGPKPEPYQCRDCQLWHLARSQSDS